MHTTLKARGLLAAGAVGAVLVLAGCAAGVDATPSETPSISPTQSATPDPTATASPSAGEIAFGGECAHMLTDAEVDALRPGLMKEAPTSWDPRVDATVGGLTCVWSSTDAYLGLTLSVHAYPAASVPAATKEAAVPGCTEEDEHSAVTCVAAGTTDGTWIHATLRGSPDGVAPDGAQRMWDLAASRVAQWPTPSPPDSTAAWWQLPTCEEIAAGLDPASLSMAEVRVEPDSLMTSTYPGYVPYVTGSALSCRLVFSTGDPASDQYEQIVFIPGGAAAAANASAVGAPASVAGATAAVLAPGLDRFEGSWSELVVTDGVNAFLVSGSIDGASPLEIRLSELLLEQLD